MSDYKTGYAQGVADAARVAKDHGIKTFKRESDWMEGHCAAALSISEKIRALTSPPSVTQEWVWDIATTKGRFKRVDCEEEFGAVIDTLAALGIEVTK